MQKNKVTCCPKFNSWDFVQDGAHVDLWAEHRWIVLDDIKFCPYCAKPLSLSGDKACAVKQTE